MKNFSLSAANTIIIFASISFVCYSLYVGEAHWTPTMEILGALCSGSLLVISFLNLLEVRKKFNGIHKNS